MELTKEIEEHAAVEVNPSPQRRWYPICKRLFDIGFALFGLLLLAPIGFFIALAIKLTDRGPVFYRQRRVGRHGKPFAILKFRSMIMNAERLGPAVTQDGDPRITRIGRVLRRTKLDELPQLWNVLTGEMSFVGPRPEVPRYVDRYTPEQRQLLNYLPGITDLATLIFRDEETLLRNATNVEEFYMQHCIPRKFNLNLQYARRANLIEDFLIIMETLCPYWLGVACGYVLALAISLWLAYLLRFDFHVPDTEQVARRHLGLLIIPLQIGCLIWRRQFVGLLSYFDLPEMKQLASGLGLAAALQFFVWFVSQGDWMPARSIIVIDFVLAFFILAGTRILLRNLRETRASYLKRVNTTPQIRRIGIVGAGELGAWLVRQLNVFGKGSRRVVAFFDDDPDKWNLRLCEVPVVGMPECIANGSWQDNLDEVVLAIPEAPLERQRQILAILSNANIRARIMPSLEEILSK